MMVHVLPGFLYHSEDEKDQLSLILNESVTDGETDQPTSQHMDGRTDGRTDPFMRSVDQTLNGLVRKMYISSFVFLALYISSRNG